MGSKAKRRHLEFCRKRRAWIAEGDRLLASIVVATAKQVQPAEPVVEVAVADVVGWSGLAASQQRRRAARSGERYRPRWAVVE